MPDEPGPELRRRSPRYLRFLLSGAAAGALAALVLTVTRGGDAEQPGALFVYLVLLLGTIGALLGGLVAVVLEGRRRR